MTGRGSIAQANRRLGLKLGMVAIGMFAFGFALAPLYDVFCEVTGLNGKTGRVDAEVAAAAGVDRARVVTVEFTGHANSGLPWEFEPLVKKIEVHPGQATTVKYRARNLANESVTGHAVPSVAPGQAASHFKKIECFCFTEQKLAAGESREMPVRFVVDPELPPQVHTVTLSYAFFNTDKRSADKYGGTASRPNATTTASEGPGQAGHQPPRAGG